MVVTRTALHRSRDPLSGRGSVLAHEGVTQRRGQEGSAVLTRCCHHDPSVSMVVVKLLARNHPINAVLQRIEVQSGDDPGCQICGHPLAEKMTSKPRL